MRKEGKRIDISGGEGLSQSPFDSLDEGRFCGGPAAAGGRGDKPSQHSVPKAEPKKPGRRGRIDICREKSGRGGKLVTVISGFKGASPRELDEWARALRKQCGVGGSVKGNRIELQGDHREAAREFFEERGFRPVFTGG